MDNHQVRDTTKKLIEYGISTNVHTNINLLATDSINSPLFSKNFQLQALGSRGCRFRHFMAFTVLCHTRKELSCACTQTLYPQQLCP